MSKTPTIMQIVPDLRTGGAERTTVDMAKAVIDRGWNSIVLSEGGRLLEELERTGSKHIIFPAGTKNPLKILRNARKIKQIAKEHGVDLIHGRSRAPAWSGFIAARQLGLPFVTTYHGLYKEQNAFKAWYNSVMTRADAVIANSNYTAGIIAERDPSCTHRITVIYRGSDMEYLDPANVSQERKEAIRSAWGLSGNERVVLNLARLTAWKGQPVLIDAMRELIKQEGFDDVVVILAGDDQGREAYSAGLKQQIENSGLQGRVRLVGHCADVAAAMAVSDLSVVASIEPEAFGRAAVEAQAAGVPVIVSDIGAVPETVLVPPVVNDEQRTGWHVPAGDAKVLSQTMALALNMAPDEKAALIARAREHTHAHFSKEAMCDATLAVYEQMLDK
ncbi:glycosyltransferase [Rhodobacteraceae bacterium RKSG542]|nr:glycosyltransferase family 4 protein [Pseudovibrio flavus]MTI17238.1 glycosyltransferase [Pseudovibrio flavus]